ncbi:hypothetical protein ACIQVO_06530 [Streptomyces sp. NPDC101062]|uniref:hypothetical protein n=1 Tax=unclassified Streptomyces TaxID=2593676 RepID=UPI002E7A06EF|nr:hypothetical protein [Streptomyces sp. JV176]MEE1803369.1 hypothetical protein [Streptomyces sp. JV176]
MNSTPVRAALAGTAVLGLMFMASGTASAAATGRPTGCTYQVADTKMTVAKCSSANGGHYRAVANCTDPDTGDIVTFVGDWRNNGSWSKSYCQGASRTLSAGIETKVT